MHKLSHCTNKYIVQKAVDANMNVARSALFEGLVLNPGPSSAASTIPSFLYGCAWKKDRTADLVYKALSAGFKGIDVAAQPRHYREDLVGVGLRKALAEGKVKRGDLFVSIHFDVFNMSVYD